MTGEKKNAAVGWSNLSVLIVLEYANGHCDKSFCVLFLFIYKAIYLNFKYSIHSTLCAGSFAIEISSDN